MEGWTDGWMDRQTDRQIDRLKYFVYHYYDAPLIDTLVKHVPINVDVKNNY